MDTNEAEAIPVILFCPICCGAVDTDSAQTDHVCKDCGQTWPMPITAEVLERMAQHSPA